MNIYVRNKIQLLWHTILLCTGTLFLASCNSYTTETTVAKKNVGAKEIAYDPKDKLLIFQKVQGDLSGKMTFSYSEGRVFGIRPDRADSQNVFGKEVFRYAGCGMKIMWLFENGNVETKVKGWLLYQNPKNGEFPTSMIDPDTGEEVEVPAFRTGIRGGTMTTKGPEVNANLTMESTAILNRGMEGAMKYRERAASEIMNLLG